MSKEYPKAQGSLLDAVLKAQRITGASDEERQRRRDAEAEIIKLCPHQIGSVAIASGMSFEGRQFRIRSVEVDSQPHYPTHTMFDHDSIEWYWVLRGPLVLKNGKVSEVNATLRFETFHVHIPPRQPIPGDAGW